MVGQATALGAVRGYILAVDSTYILRLQGAHFRVVAAGRQYDSEELRQWTMKTFNAETAIPTRNEKHGRSLKVDAKFKVSGPKRLVNAYHKRLCVERIFKKLKLKISPNHKPALRATIQPSKQPHKPN